MKGKSVGLVILWWSEVIVSLRILLFTVPVMINKFLAERFVFSGAENGFIVLLTLTAVFYLLSGLTSLAGFRFWKTLHVAAMLFTGLLTYNAVRGFGQAGIQTHYFYPAVFAVVTTTLSFVFGKGAEPVSAA